MGILTPKKKKSFKELLRGKPTTVLTFVVPENYNLYKTLNYINNDLLEEASRFKKEALPSMYSIYNIPKKKGGYRTISNPNPELKQYQKNLTKHFKYLGLNAHNCAYAYIEKRDTTLNAEQHKDAKMIISLDIKKFFDNIRMENLLFKLSNFENIKYTVTQLEQLLTPCFLNDVLPQGSCASPLLSNLYMVEFDQKVYEYCAPRKLTYTRYADDIYISSKEEIKNPISIIKHIQKLLTEHSNHQLILNKEKQKILRPGRCYITGVKINKENKLSYGSEKKTILKHMLHNLFVKEQSGTLTTEEVQETLGLLSYARRIEPDYFNYLEKKILQKHSAKEQTLVIHFRKFL